MKSTDATPPYETLEIGTPKDYTDDVYRFYFEIGMSGENALNIIRKFLGPEKSKQILLLPHGYEIELPIQCVPDLIQELVQEGIGIYQVVRYAKTENVWV